jgi:hypothetical protein
VRRRRALHAATVAAFALGALSRATRAQDVARARAHGELRADYIGPRPHTVQIGAGVNLPVGPYLRVGVIGAGGVGWRDGQSGASGRADVIGRFALDPFREHRWGLSAGGGLSVRYDATGANSPHRWRALVALVIDLEGPRAGSVAPAVQLGLGGGLRAGVVLRGAQSGFR